MRGPKRSPETHPARPPPSGASPWARREVQAAEPLETVPCVAIVGAPNVGKSRLFNRLAGQARAIVHDRPGVTRDRVEGSCEWMGRRFRIIDTGGLLPADPDELSAGTGRQVLRGISEAALLVFVVDGRAGLTPLDQNLAQVFRSSGKPLVLAVNKVDAPGQEGRIADFYSLGFPDPIPISAEEGRGVGDLMDRILSHLPAEPDRLPAAAVPSEVVRLAVAGRPNVGKSTLFNRLAGQERSVVSPVPGTTRDPVDAEFWHRDRRFRIVDTAGWRRRARAQEEEVEMQSVERAFSAMKRADLVVVLLDAVEPATHQDLAVVGVCQRVRRPIIVAVNKVDRLPVAAGTLDTRLAEIRSRLRFAEETPIVALSALHDRGVDDLLDVLDQMAEEISRRIPTTDLNRVLAGAIRRRAPVGPDRPPRLYYITQSGSSPPSFLVFTNGARLNPSYRRYLARHLRQALGFQHTPVSLRFRRRAGRP